MTSSRQRDILLCFETVLQSGLVQEGVKLVGGCRALLGRPLLRRLARAKGAARHRHAAAAAHAERRGGATWRLQKAWPTEARPTGQAGRPRQGRPHREGARARG